MNPLLEQWADRVIAFEGWSPTVHGDYGNNSIGYGTRTTDPDELAGKAITKEEGRRRLIERGAKDFEKIRKFGKEKGYDWNDNQIAALASFRYNIGNINDLTAGGTRSNEEIAKMMPAYIKAGGTEQGGLIDRRKAEVDWFNSPVAQQPEVNVPYREGYKAPQEQKPFMAASTPAVSQQPVEQAPMASLAQITPEQPRAMVANQTGTNPLGLFQYLSNQQNQDEMTDFSSWLTRT